MGGGTATVYVALAVFYVRLSEQLFIETALLTMSTATGANENNIIAHASSTERPLRAYARNAVKPNDA